VSGNIIAIVGRPNVGKSALFNRIAGRRIAIVHEQAGVTRDRVSARTKFSDKTLEIIDTGGIGLVKGEKSASEIEAAVARQTEIAIQTARVILFVVDVTAGVAPLDLEVAQKLRASGKPVLLVVNKVDNAAREPEVAAFSELGFEKMFAISAVHGHGVTKLLEEAAQFLEIFPEKPPKILTKIAIVGRPNVGKSSLINKILREERVIVSEIPGTTRDSVDIELENCVLIDTAGMRHERKIRTSVDKFGLMRAEKAVERCDLAVLVLDARDGVTEQDKKIAGKIADAGKGCIICVNKWDLAAEELAKAPKKFRREYEQAVRAHLFFVDFAPILFASAKTGEAVNEIFRAVERVERAAQRQIATAQLNRAVQQAVSQHPPPMVGGRRLKIFYVVQTGTRPPQFLFFVNDKKLVTADFEKFLSAKIRRAEAYEGWPMRFLWQGKREKA
jgi:GTP-binding protein